MAKEKEIKTNAMRILDRMKIPYTHYTYECDEFIDGMQIVEKLNLKPEQVYKTLVTQGHSKAYFVFVIPVAEELDLKAAARAVGEKESGKSGRGEISGDDPCKGYQPDHRLYPRRLYGNRHEKAV